MLGFLFAKLRIIIKNPLITFVYGILSKWFIVIFVTAIVVVFWVFKGLSDAGILQIAENVVFRAFDQTKAVAQYCIPKIMNLEIFWDCLQNTPTYTPSPEEEMLQDNLQKIFEPLNSNAPQDSPKDPYMEE